MLRAIGFYALVAVGIPLSLLQPFSGLLLYLFFAHGHPADFVWPGYIFNYGLLLVPALLAGYLLFEVRKSPPRFRGMFLLLFFWAWLAMAAVLAFNTQPAYDMLSRFSKMFVMAFLIAAMVNTEDRIRKVLTVIGASLGFLGVKSFISVIVTAGQYRIQGPGGLMSEENEYALGMNMAIPILYWMASLEQRHWAKRAYQFAAFACAVTVVFTRSRSGFLGLMMVCLLIAMHSRRKLLVPFGLAIAVTVFLAFAPEASIDRYKSIPTATQTDASAIGRIEAWETAVSMAKAHPLFGVGLRNFELTFLDYSSFEPRAPHNAFMALMAEAGIPSCLLFAALVLSASGACWANWRRLRYSQSHQALATYCLIVHATLLVYLVPNFFINRQDFDLMYHLVGLSAGMSVVVRRALRAERTVVSQAGLNLSNARVAM
ncbi:MAG TPA: putative O-glycosylation ligase, exosortase A system-associated [Candidatus Angelobacter sp.]|jgi:probable O-glycosylation ligase (exosortase A-associated)